ncbi:hypothetical protein SAMN05216315_103129 [Nitrosospira sp. Nsp18]|uniref:hypothetical protein n=1 Tax=Nitrosospira sp. Nsp18 TaxID=1855334 RepID=UPI0008897AC2|nr:hypothetical protein [Nitrosospira sp. Nsp18]SDA12595.1 hypothetical protein SAMN05216315_103129 [Nitrosospira sp. Nsp18]
MKVAVLIRINAAYQAAIDAMSADYRRAKSAVSLNRKQKPMPGCWIQMLQGRSWIARQPGRAKAGLNWLARSLPMPRCSHLPMVIAGKRQ